MGTVRTARVRCCPGPAWLSVTIDNNFINGIVYFEFSRMNNNLIVKQCAEILLEDKKTGIVSCDSLRFHGV